MKKKIRMLSWLLLLALSQPAAAQESAADFNQSLQKAISAKDFDEATRLLDQSEEVPLQARINGRQQLASFLMQANRPQEAMVQVEKAASIAIAAVREGKLPSPSMVGAVTLAAMMSRSIEGSKSQELVSSALEILQSKLSNDELTTEHRSVIDLLRTKLQAGDPSQAQANQAQLSEYIGKCEALFIKESENQNKAAMMLSIWNTQMQIVDAEQAEKVFEKSTKLAESLIKESVNPNVVTAYISMVSSYIGRTARSAPDSASKALESAKVFLDGIESDDNRVTQSIEGFLKNTKNMERTIEGAKRLLSMVGQPAPEIDPMEWINGEPLSKLSDLKGKVVLIDFWAVWCGPCIATFPHLKHLDDEYREKGLTILGVTRQYNMKWDESKDNYVRSETPVELEEEMAMLEKFIAKHKLSHRTMLTPEKSDMQSQYAVTGIPHAVVIDKQGVVRLVKVGSGSQNAEEIESTIKKLLAE